MAAGSEPGVSVTGSASSLIYSPELSEVPERSPVAEETVPDDPLGELLAVALEAATVEDIHAVCAKACAAFGLDHFLYGARFPSSFVKPFLLIVSGYPSSWRERYMARNYLLVDPAVLHCSQSVRPLLWEELAVVERRDRRVARFMAEAREHGLRSGLSIPVHGAQGEVAMLSVASVDDGPAVRQRLREALPPLALVACYVHEAACRLVDQGKLPFRRPQLTQRERECLLWAAEGKTAWETAQILGISERTVIFHLQNVGEKLGCNNRQQTIARAIAQGLISTIIA